MKNTEEDSKKFWEEVGNKKGGKVGFYTFANFLGESGGKPVSLGGLIYTVDDIIYFEDFEKDNWFAKIISRRQKYEKTEFSLRKEDIEEVKIISKSSALNCISGLIEDTGTKPFAKILAILFQSVIQIRLKSTGSFFFDIMRDKDFIKALK